MSNTTINTAANTANKAVTTVRNEAARAFYAGVGVNDLAINFVRDTVVSTTRRTTQQVTDAQKDAKTRRETVETKVAELQTELKGYPTKARNFVEGNVETVVGQYDGLVKRGETLVGRLRSQDAIVPARATEFTKAAEAKLVDVRDDIAEEVEKVTGQVAQAAKSVAARVKPIRSTPPATAGKPVSEAVEKQAAEKVVDIQTADKVTTADVTTAPKAPAAKPAAKKAPAKKAPAKKAPATKAPANKAPANKTTDAKKPEKPAEKAAQKTAQKTAQKAASKDA